VKPVVEPPTLSILYSASAIATGGLLDGSVRTLDGGLDLTLAKPKELGGDDSRAGNDPYQLLAAGYSAAFHAALQDVCLGKGTKFPSKASVQATVGFGLRPDGGFGLQIALDVSLPGVARPDAETLIARACHVCSVCQATRPEALRIQLV
jgi:lipoyl-dependent peroxiredoxin